MNRNTDTTVSRTDCIVVHMDIYEITTTWCRMWSEDPALAHDLMTDDCVQWAATTPGLDSVVGPRQQQQFVTAYRAQHVNVFAPRTIVLDGDMFGYLWDVTLPDGTVKTGIDVNVLSRDRICQNWTVVAERRQDEPDPAPGDAVSADALRELVVEWAREQGYAVHRRPVVDAANGRVALLRSSTAADGTKVGGVDVLTVRDGVVEPFWSITGTRAFRY